ncbi:hypothetical protein Sjap_004167 [Stephania japonica]|uniref:CS domain-containing protein n=1 Tax=Stephania japonica TaxID=461633 RepID=A0AAP0PIU3_9MAGN
MASLVCTPTCFNLLFSNTTNPNPISRKTGSLSWKNHALHHKLALSNRFSSVSFSSNLSTVSVNNNTREYEFSDGAAEIELRLPLGNQEIQNSKYISVDAEETSLIIRARASGSLLTLMETSQLYDKIKPAETIWYIDEDQLVINLKKQDSDLNWPDIMESWESLTAGAPQILKGTSVYIVGDSTEINEKVARELAVGLGYTPLNTRELLETFAKQPIDSWLVEEGIDSIVEAESSVLESLSSHIRAVVATLGTPYGAMARADKWQHLYSGFSIWLSQSGAIVCISRSINLISPPGQYNADEGLAKEEAQRQIRDATKGYANAEVVIKLAGWLPNESQTVAQACLSALKRLVLSDKNLPGKKSLYIRLGCRGDWPNIKPPGWHPAAGDDTSET